MAKPEQAPELLMPKATAVWLIDNTVLTFSQIATFTGLTEIEIEALANEDIGKGLVGRNPVEHKETTQDSLDNAQKDPAKQLVHSKSNLPTVRVRSKGPKYTPVAKRGDKPNAIAYVLKHFPDIQDAQIVKLVGTTKPTIAAIRERTHADIANLQPRHPVDLGLCTYKEFDAAYEKALIAAGKDPESVKAAEEAKRIAAESGASDDDNQDNSGSNAGNFDFSHFLSDN